MVSWWIGKKRSVNKVESPFKTHAILKILKFNIFFIGKTNVCVISRTITLIIINTNFCYCVHAPNIIGFYLMSKMKENYNIFLYFLILFAIYFYIN